MRVVIVADFGHVYGGAEKVAILEAAGLANRGVEVAFLCGKGPVDERLTSAGVEVVCLDQDEFIETGGVRGVLRGLWNTKAADALARLLDERPIEAIVHVHTWTHVLSASIFFVARQRGAKILVTAHDYFLVCPNGGMYDYNHAEKCSRKACSASCIVCDCDKRSYAQKLYRCVRFCVQRTALRKCDLAVASISDTSEAILRLASMRAPFFHLPNPIEAPCEGDRDGDPPLECPFPEDTYYLYVGRMSPEKGPDLLCEASRDIKNKVVFIGDGPDLADLRERYPECVFLGRKSYGEIISYYKAARALVIPSRWYEGLPLAVCEARSLGVGPIVTPEGCAATEAAGNLDNGSVCVFESGSSESLARVLRKLEDDNVLRDERSRKLSQPCFLNPDSHIDLLIGLYERIAS